MRRSPQSGMDRMGYRGKFDRIVMHWSYQDRGQVGQALK
jgi:hypothetical protein